MTEMNVEDLLAREHSDLHPRLREMLDEFPKFREEILPSKYWEEFNKKNLKQLSGQQLRELQAYSREELFYVHRNALESADAVPDAFAACCPGRSHILQRVFGTTPRAFQMVPVDLLQPFDQTPVGIR